MAVWGLVPKLLHLDTPHAMPLVLGCVSDIQYQGHRSSCSHSDTQWFSAVARRGDGASHCCGSWAFGMQQAHCGTDAVHVHCNSHWSGHARCLLCSLGRAVRHF
jgi:hypothetical protein